MQWKLRAACFVFACLSGCAHQPPAPPAAQLPPQPATGSPVSNGPASQPTAAATPVATAPSPAGSSPTPSGPTPSGPATSSAVKPAGSATAPAAASPPRPASRPPPKQATTAPGAPPGSTSTPSRSASAQPTLDLKSLEQRLRDTKAIGVFTKLSLKNQVDDLLAEMKAFHGGQPNPPLSELRQSYESLLLKVVTVLQKGDPQLASAVSSSRDSIWGLLADPQKFSQIT